MTDGSLVEVENLEKYFHDGAGVLDRLLGRDTQPVKAVDGLTFDIREGETLGLVGESGCGKSTTGETILDLQSPTGGAVRFDGENVYEMGSTAKNRFRERTGMVFQDPLSSLDPRMTAGQIVREPLRVHNVGSSEDRKEQAADLLDRVGLSADQRDRYPHEFSGGQQQRIAIARALALEPDFLVLDEPVSALDVSVQAQILNLLDDLQAEFGLTYLFIAHDLSVVRHICDRVAVMYLGEIAEMGRVEAIFEDPKHPYTKALLESVPRADVDEYHREVSVLEGDVPSPRDPPSGCRFRTRCPSVIAPENVEIDQRAYREVMDYRERLEDGDLSSGDAEALLVGDGDGDGRDGDGGDGDGTVGDVDRISETLRSEVLIDGLTGENRETVERSLEQAASGDREAAVETLRERFESVCERRDPQLQSTEHPAACHLFEQPDDRGADAPETDEGGESATAD